jgi:hypothetical protein
LTKKEVVQKDSIIKTLDKQKKYLDTIISRKDEMLAKEEQISNAYKKQLFKQKGTTFLYKALSVLGVISTALLLIKP